MDWLLYVVASIFMLLGAACVILVVLQLPGGWVLLLLALGIELSDRWYLSDPEPTTFGWLLLGICLALLAVGELIEFLASAVGAQRGGATKRGMIGSLVGGVIGAIAFTPLIPVPVIGTLIGAVAGTFIGAVVGETSGPEARAVSGSMKPAIGASIGRVIGTTSKVGITIAMWIVLTVAAFWP